MRVDNNHHCYWNAVSLLYRTHNCAAAQQSHFNRRCLKIFPGNSYLAICSLFNMQQYNMMKGNFVRCRGGGGGVKAFVWRMGREDENRELSQECIPSKKLYWNNQVRIAHILYEGRGQGGKLEPTLHSLLERGESWKGLCSVTKLIIIAFPRGNKDQLCSAVRQIILMSEASAWIPSQISSWEAWRTEVKFV